MLLKLTPTFFFYFWWLLEQKWQTQVPGRADVATVSVSERLDNNKEEGFFLVIIINFYKGFNELLSGFW